MIHPKLKEAYEAYGMALKQLEITKREAVEAEKSIKAGLKDLDERNEILNAMDLKQILTDNNIQDERGKN